ncbi:MAG: hypothetical protein AMJ73_08410 [candidate division Zixibacteria bacterium SM1_73]|nr:MAG: hypothetical protein AMJ73_08410 [candidate division Zixibacteria bacterium SM1_73]
MRQLSLLAIGFLILGGFLLIFAAEVQASIPVRASISGVINSDSLIATASGSLDTSTGYLDGNVTFDSVPSGYHPAASLSCLLCVICCIGAHAVNGGENLLELSEGNYSAERVLNYSTGDILSVSDTVWTDNDTLKYESEWNGTYTGPTNLTRILPYKQYMTPGGPGVVAFEGFGTVRTGDPLLTDIRVEWSGSYTLHNEAELDSSQVSTISHEFTWDGTTYHVWGYSTIEPAYPHPTLTQWGLIVLVVLIVSSSVFILLRRRKAALPV